MAKEKPPRTHLAEPFETFLRACAEMGLSGPDLSQRLGYTRTAWTGWKASDKMPAVAARLCQALIAAKSRPLGRFCLVAVLDGKTKEETVANLLNMMGAKCWTIPLEPNP